MAQSLLITCGGQKSDHQEPASTAGSRGGALAGLVWLAAIASLALLGACGDNVASTGSVPPEVFAAPETAPYRQAIMPEQLAVIWVSADRLPERPAAPAELNAVEAAISTASDRLKAVDYSSLAYPGFYTATRSLDLKSMPPFDGRNPRLDAVGSSGERSWSLYEWRGPEFPANPERPTVRRWLEVFALYDLQEKRVLKLLATIFGEANE